MSVLDQLRKRRHDLNLTDGSSESFDAPNSLLFDKKDAAKIEIDALHMLSLSGLEQLKKLEPRVKPFEAVLFSPTQRDLPRELQDQERNAQLNESIETFLALVAPLFPLKATHKVLEYLIRCYRIHIYNRQALLRLLLPFHQTLIFLRLLKCITVDDLPSFRFFDNSRRTGQPILRSVIVRKLQYDREFFIILLDSLQLTVSSRTNHVLYHSFVTASIIELITRHDALNDPMLRVIWPYLLAAFSSSDVHYYHHALVVFVCASWKSRIDPQLLSAAIETMLSRAQRPWRSAALCALIVVLQHTAYLTETETSKSATQHPTVAQNEKPSKYKQLHPIITDRSFQVLLSWQELSDRLISLIQRHSPEAHATDSTLAVNLDLFWRVFLPYLSINFFKNSASSNLLYSLLNRIELAKYIPDVIVQLFESFEKIESRRKPQSHFEGEVSKHKNQKIIQLNSLQSASDQQPISLTDTTLGSQTLNIQNSLSFTLFQELLDLIDTKYPAQLDLGVASMLRLHPSDHSWRQLFVKGRHHPLQVGEDVTTIQLALQQKEPELKMLALQELISMSSQVTKDPLTNLNSKSFLPCYKQLLSDTVRLHCQSSDPHLVLHSLHLLDKNPWIEFENEIEALELLIDLDRCLITDRCHPWYHVPLEFKHRVAQIAFENLIKRHATLSVNSNDQMSQLKKQKKMRQLTSIVLRNLFTKRDNTNDDSMDICPQPSSSLLPTDFYTASPLLPLSQLALRAAHILVDLDSMHPLFSLLPNNKSDGINDILTNPAILFENISKSAAQFLSKNTVDNQFWISLLEAPPTRVITQLLLQVVLSKFANNLTVLPRIAIQISDILLSSLFSDFKNSYMQQGALATFKSISLYSSNISKNKKQDGCNLDITFQQDFLSIQSIDLIDECHFSYTAPNEEIVAENACQLKYDNFIATHAKSMLQRLIWILYHLLDSLVKLVSLTTAADRLSIDSQILKLFELVMLFPVTEPFSQHLKILFSHLATATNIVQFLERIWCRDPAKTSRLLIVRVLQILSQFLKAEAVTTSESELYQSDENLELKKWKDKQHLATNTWMSLLVPLLHPNPIVRHMTLSCLDNTLMLLETCRINIHQLKSRRKSEHSRQDRPLNKLDSHIAMLRSCLERKEEFNVSQKVLHSWINATFVDPYHLNSANSDSTNQENIKKSLDESSEVSKLPSSTQPISASDLPVSIQSPISSFLDSLIPLALRLPTTYAQYCIFELLIPITHPKKLQLTNRRLQDLQKLVRFNKGEVLGSDVFDYSHQSNPNLELENIFYTHKLILVLIRQWQANVADALNNKPELFRTFVDAIKFQDCKEDDENQVSIKHYVDSSARSNDQLITSLANSNLERIQDGASNVDHSMISTSSQSSDSLLSHQALCLSIQLSSLDQLEPHFFSLLSRPLQCQIVKLLCKLVVLSHSHVVQMRVQQLLRTLPIDTKIFVEILWIYVQATSPPAELPLDEPLSKRKPSQNKHLKTKDNSLSKRHSENNLNSDMNEASLTTNNQNETTLDEKSTSLQSLANRYPSAPTHSLVIARLTAILEVLQASLHTLVSSKEFFEPLFTLILHAVNPESILYSHPSVEYVQQLVFTLLIAMSKSIVKGLELIKVTDSTVIAHREAINMMTTTAHILHPNLSNLATSIEIVHQNALQSNNSILFDPNENQHYEPKSYEGLDKSDPYTDLDHDNLPPLILSSQELSSLAQHCHVGAIVQSTRIYSSPALQNAALLLLSRIARAFPGLVLVNMINIFSVMGTSVQRLDDHYTFNVIAKTVERVIPALLSHSSVTEGRVSASALLEMLVEKIDLIVKHRRIALFGHILTKVLNRGYLSYVLWLLLKKQRHEQILNVAINEVKELPQGTILSNQNPKISNLASNPSLSSQPKEPEQSRHRKRIRTRDIQSISTQSLQPISIEENHNAHANSNTRMDPTTIPNIASESQRKKLVKDADETIDSKDVISANSLFSFSLSLILHLAPQDVFSAFSELICALSGIECIRISNFPICSSNQSSSSSLYGFKPTERLQQYAKPFLLLVENYLSSRTFLDSLLDLPRSDLIKMQNSLQILFKVLLLFVGSIEKAIPDLLTSLNGIIHQTSDLMPMERFISALEGLIPSPNPLLANTTLDHPSSQDSRTVFPIGPELRHRALLLFNHRFHKIDPDGIQDLLLSQTTIEHLLAFTQSQLGLDSFDGNHHTDTDFEPVEDKPFHYHTFKAFNKNNMLVISTASLSTQIIVSLVAKCNGYHPMLVALTSTIINSSKKHLGQLNKAKEALTFSSHQSDYHQTLSSQSNPSSISARMKKNRYFKKIVLLTQDTCISLGLALAVLVKALGKQLLIYVNDIADIVLALIDNAWDNRILTPKSFHTFGEKQDRSSNLHKSTNYQLDEKMLDQSPVTSQQQNAAIEILDVFVRSLHQFLAPHWFNILSKLVQLQVTTTNTKFPSHQCKASRFHHIKSSTQIPLAKDKYEKSSRSSINQNGPVDLTLDVCKPLYDFCPCHEAILHQCALSLLQFIGKNVPLRVLATPIELTFTNLIELADTISPSIERVSYQEASLPGLTGKISPSKQFGSNNVVMYNPLSIYLATAFQHLALLLGNIASSLTAARSTLVSSSHQILLRLLLLIGNYVQAIYHNNNPSTYNPICFADAQVQSIETAIAQAVENLVLQLSDKSFGPVLNEFHTWALATTDESQSEEDDSSISINILLRKGQATDVDKNETTKRSPTEESLRLLLSSRQRLFWRVMHSLASSLHRLVVPHFVPILHQFLEEYLEPLTSHRIILGSDDPSHKTTHVIDKALNQALNRLGIKIINFPSSLSTPINMSLGLRLNEILTWILGTVTIVSKYAESSDLQFNSIQPSSSNVSSSSVTFGANHVMTFTSSSLHRWLDIVVQQLQLTLVDAYKCRITQAIQPCIIELAQTLGDAHWPNLNQALLDLTHHTNSSIRYTSLLVLTELYNQLGQAYLTQLPSSIQHFAELLEDTNPLVEKQCLNIIQLIENILGEEGGVMKLLSH